MESKRNDIFLIAFGLVMLILISCKPKPEVSFDVDSFHKSLEEIASGVIEWTSDLEEEQKDTLNVGDKFECDRALSDSVVLREMKGYLGMMTLTVPWNMAWGLSVTTIMIKARLFGRDFFLCAGTESIRRHTNITKMITQVVYSPI